jgi:pimeloyl-ACP methyl ester carboxylesterase
MSSCAAVTVHVTAPRRATVGLDIPGLRPRPVPLLAAGLRLAGGASAAEPLPQFVTEVDGLDRHFIHLRSPHAEAIPLVITHGWPGSVAEFAKVIEPLADPVADGGDAADAFHVVCPSLPGLRVAWSAMCAARCHALILCSGAYDGGLVREDDGLDPVTQAEFREDLSDVSLDGGIGDHEPLRDFGV